MRKCSSAYCINGYITSKLPIALVKYFSLNTILSPPAAGVLQHIDPDLYGVLLLANGGRRPVTISKF